MRRRFAHFKRVPYSFVAFSVATCANAFGRRYCGIERDGEPLRLCRGLDYWCPATKSLAAIRRGVPPAKSRSLATPTAINQATAIRQSHQPVTVSSRTYIVPLGLVVSLPRKERPTARGKLPKVVQS